MSNIFWLVTGQHVARLCGVIFEIYHLVYYRSLRTKSRDRNSSLYLNIGFRWKAGRKASNSDMALGNYVSLLDSTIQRNKHDFFLCKLLQTAANKRLRYIEVNANNDRVPIHLIYMSYQVTKENTFFLSQQSSTSSMTWSCISFMLKRSVGGISFESDSCNNNQMPETRKNTIALSRLKYMSQSKKALVNSANNNSGCLEYKGVGTT